MNTRHLNQLGVYGYESVEPVILAALVSGDPLLLVGKAGTGKTYLLNSLSEALGLEHRHYNASLISFDDLVGFPYPEEGGTGIRYIETPATIWGAESVLVDEINRCKPEHQNRLFSLVHERRIQGLSLPSLRYRWAAMNPAGLEESQESYLGCEPLDAALADRFAFIVRVADWDELEEADRLAIADPRGEGAESRDASGLGAFLQEARERFEAKHRDPDPRLLEYAVRVITLLNAAGVRLSPRRARQLSRNLLAVESVSKLPRERIFRLALHWSLPQRAALQSPEDAVVQAAHRSAWELVCAEGEDRWLHDFHSEPELDRKIVKLLTLCECPEIGSIAVSQFLASESPARAATFALALFPALVSWESGPVGAEGVAELGRVARPLLEIQGELQWRDFDRKPYLREGGVPYVAEHPDHGTVEACLRTLKGGRKQRARQLFYHLLLQQHPLADAQSIEATFNKCVQALRKCHGTA